MQIQLSCPFFDSTTSVKDWKQLAAGYALIQCYAYFGVCYAFWWFQFCKSVPWKCIWYTQFGAWYIVLVSSTVFFSCMGHLILANQLCIFIKLVTDFFGEVTNQGVPPKQLGFFFGQLRMFIVLVPGNPNLCNQFLFYFILFCVLLSIRFSLNENLLQFWFYYQVLLWLQLLANKY